MSHLSSLVWGVRGRSDRGRRDTERRVVKERRASGSKDLSAGSTHHDLLLGRGRTLEDTGTSTGLRTLPPLNEPRPSHKRETRAGPRVGRTKQFSSPEGDED